jgi:hypothetical protein
MRDSLKQCTVRLSLMIAAISIAVPAKAQDAGLAVHVGSMGVGADAAVMVHHNIGLRASGNYFPFDINFNSSGVDYNLEMPSPQFLLLADLYPTGSFRVSAGLMISSTSFDLTGELDGPVDIGGTTYTPAEVGNLTGTIETRDVSPYIGIGFGNPTANRVGFFVDLGVAFHGNPEASAAADGPVASQPGFQQDLDREVQEIQDDVEDVIVYPVLSIGISIGLGR